MKIAVGSTNPAKIAAVQDVFFSDSVVANNVPSLVNNQPFSDAETRQGAINRASECMKTTSSADVGIGLEGGVMTVGGVLHLCNWGALVTAEHTVFTASGARIPLPEHIKNELTAGRELGDVMDSYAQRQNVRHEEGAIGIFTNEHMERKDMFVHVIRLLNGQWDYWK
ncbi:DUF84 family protein [Lentibacillus halophilus]|uniref:inosine/xanthosine triphosphatase n=2 Tax=Lentibacillus halophilus TaxID=295065 RepID=A0ABP3IW03_9BACI